MWLCGNCGEMAEDTFDACWKCGTVKDGQAEAPPVATLKCLRCARALDFAGRKRFQEGTNWGLLGEVGEVFVNREHFNVYVCPGCGHVELFVAGIGEELRQEQS